LNIKEVLNVARSFIIMNLNGDFYSIKFSGVTFNAGIWTVKCSFKEAGSGLREKLELKISNSSGEVISFNVGE